MIVERTIGTSMHYGEAVQLVPGFDTAIYP